MFSNDAFHGFDNFLQFGLTFGLTKETEVRLRVGGPYVEPPVGIVETVAVEVEETLGLFDAYEMVTDGIHGFLLAFNLEVDFARIGVGCNLVDDLAHRLAFLLALGQKAQHDGGGQKGGVGVVEVAEIIVSCQLTTVAAIQLAEL